jgi:GTP-binding protein
MINYLTAVSELARTSKKPGKTQTINLYKVMENPEWIIADLPGYGYAQVSKSIRGQWSTMIEQYVLRREYVMCTFVLIDIRHAMQENDRAFLQFLGEHQIPFCLLFTKSDKLKPAQLHKALMSYEESLLESWESMPPYIVTSSLANKGRDEILRTIRDINHTFASSEHGKPT